MMLSMLLVMLFNVAPAGRPESPERRQQVLGVLEETSSGVADAPVAVTRVAFARRDGRWAPVEHSPTEPQDLQRLHGAAPRKVAWRVCFDGRELGPVSASRPEHWDGSASIGTLRVDGGRRLPWVGGRSKNFSGWLGMPVHRPLVVNTEGACADPERWKPAQPPQSVVRALLPRFEAVARAGSSADAGSTADAARSLGPLDESAIAVASGYLSAKGERLVTLRLTRVHDEEGPQKEWAQQTFFVEATGTVTPMGNGLRLIDAGDYDRDGHSELVFKLEGYNADGYVLVWDHGRQKALFDWSYH